MFWASGAWERPLKAITKGRLDHLLGFVENNLFIFCVLGIELWT
jgi:hypothetical protein